VSEAEFLAALAPLAFQAALVFARLGAAAMMLPGIGEQEIPAPIRLGFALALVPLMLPVLSPGLPVPPESAGEAFGLIAIEVLFGVWIGGLARLVVLAFSIAGQAIGSMIGLASALIQDPSFGAGGTALSRLFGLAAVVFLLVTGLFAIPLRALVDSYQVLPVGAAFPAGDAVSLLVAATAASLDLALRITAPFALAAIILNIALGLLARIAPQVQVYFVAVPGQLLGGLALLALLTPLLLAAYGEAAREAFLSLPGAR
jgi:flagellar biosynthesis protein FliR